MKVIKNLFIKKVKKCHTFEQLKESEIPELQEELNSLKPERKKEAVNKIIAAMTVGKDVWPLFPHVVKCMETNNWN